jgi:hypothetical protein
MDGREGGKMDGIEVLLDGESIQMASAPRREGDEVLVPLTEFCEAVGAEAKVLDGNGVLAVCREDLCIPLNASGGDTVMVEGETFARLSAFGGPLGLEWSMDNGSLVVRTGSEATVGLGIGSRPPDFTLPDLFTGEQIGPGDYGGKRVAFFMWASW